LTKKYTWCIFIHMRTNIDLNDQLLAEAQKYSKAKSKRALVEEALSAFIAMKAEEKRLWDYKERLQNLRAKTMSVRLRSDTRALLRQDRDSR
jgi:Arc/MetJ family transcription regulator